MIEPGIELERFAIFGKGFFPSPRLLKNLSQGIERIGIIRFYFGVAFQVRDGLIVLVHEGEVVSQSIQSAGEIGVNLKRAPVDLTAASKSAWDCRRRPAF